MSKSFKLKIQVTVYVFAVYQEAPVGHCKAHVGSLCCLVPKGKQGKLLSRVPMVCSLPDSSIHGISQARILECIAISFSRDLPIPGIECTSPALQAVRFFTTEPLGRGEEAVKIAPLTRLLLELNMIIYVKGLIICT